MRCHVIRELRKRARGFDATDKVRYTPKKRLVACHGTQRDVVHLSVTASCSRNVTHRNCNT